MSKAALVLVGIVAAVGIGLAIRDADSEPTEPRKPTQDDPDADDGEVIPEPAQPPQPSGDGGEGNGPVPDPGSGNGAPRIRSALPGSPRAELIPVEVRNVDLSGHEVYEYQGINMFGPPGGDFDTWTIFNSLNDMDMVVYKSVVNPADWIAMFVKNELPSSPSPFIVYKVGDGPNKDWMLQALAKVSHL